MGKEESPDLAKVGSGGLLTHPSLYARTISGYLVERHSGLGYKNQDSLEP